eukprot:1926155-Amphidinium_carterae.1
MPVITRARSPPSVLPRLVEPLKQLLPNLCWHTAPHIYASLSKSVEFSPCKYLLPVFSLALWDQEGKTKVVNCCIAKVET